MMAHRSESNFYHARLPHFAQLVARQWGLPVSENAIAPITLTLTPFQSPVQLQEAETMIFPLKFKEKPSTPARSGCCPS